MAPRKAAIATIGLAVGCLLAAAATAGTISIRIVSTAELVGDALVVAVTVANDGDEAAGSVAATLRFRGAEVRGATRARLGPGDSFDETLTLPAPSLGAGRWPYQLAVSYTDTNQYPFEALHVGTIEAGGPPPARVAVAKFEPGSVADAGELEVRVKNLSDVARDVRLRVLLPEALEGKPSGETLELDAWEERPVSLRLVNRAALPGSRYPVFVALEYEDGPIHQALVARSTVEVLGEESQLVSGGRYLWFGAALFGLLFVALLAFRLARR